MVFPSPSRNWRFLQETGRTPRVPRMPPPGFPLACHGGFLVHSQHPSRAARCRAASWAQAALFPAWLKSWLVVSLLWSCQSSSQSLPNSLARLLGPHDCLPFVHYLAPSGCGIFWANSRRRKAFCRRPWSHPPAPPPSPHPMLSLRLTDFLTLGFPQSVPPAWADSPSCQEESSSNEKLSLLFSSVSQPASTQATFPLLPPLPPALPGPHLAGASPTQIT